MRTRVLVAFAALGVLALVATTLWALGRLAEMGGAA